MKKEELLNEMYALIKRFDRDLIDLMNLMRKCGELSEEIDLKQGSCFYDSNALTEKGLYVYKEGEQYETIVERILPKVGAFCRLGSRTDGMIHISKISETRIDSVEDVLHIGDKVKVEIIKVGDKGIDLKLLKIMN